MLGLRRPYIQRDRVPDQLQRFLVAGLLVGHQPHHVMGRRVTRLFQHDPEIERRGLVQPVGVIEDLGPLQELWDAGRGLPVHRLKTPRYPMWPLPHIARIKTIVSLPRQG